MEIYCPSCQRCGKLPPPFPKATACPSCGAQVRKRARPSPGPQTDWRALQQAIVSLHGGVAVGAFALLAVLGVVLVYAKFLALALLFMVAVKLASQALKIQGGLVEFPELADTDQIVVEAGFAVLFVSLPLWLGLVAPDLGAAGVPLALLSLLLLAYAPAALMLVLQAQALQAAFRVPRALPLLRGDPRGYGLMLALMAAVVGLCALLDYLWRLGSGPWAVVWLLLAPLAGAAIPFAFGMIGLHARQNAHLLGLPVGEEWVLLPHAPPPRAAKEELPPQAAAEPTKKAAPEAAVDFGGGIDLPDDEPLPPASGSQAIVTGVELDLAALPPVQAAPVQPQPAYTPAPQPAMPPYPPQQAMPPYPPQQAMPPYPPQQAMPPYPPQPAYPQPPQQAYPQPPRPPAPQPPAPQPPPASPPAPSGAFLDILGQAGAAPASDEESLELDLDATWKRDQG